MFKLLRGIVLLVGLLVLLMSGIMAAGRHDQIAPSWVMYFSDDDLYLMRSDGSDKRLIVADTMLYSLPEWSPDGRWIVYPYEDRNLAFGIHRLPILPNRSRQVQMLVGGSVFCPRWSPNGKWLLFCSYQDSSTLYRIQPDGTNRQALETGLDIILKTSSWSPDSQWIAFVARDGLYRMRSDGTDLQAIPTMYDIPDIPCAPQWSPDGQWILFLSWEELEHEPLGIHRIRPDGTDEQWLADAVADYPMTSLPQWSPDGEWIVYATEDGIIHKMRADGSEQQAITPSTQYSDTPQWSPDGEWILFRSVLWGQFEIRRMRTDGTDQQILVEARYNTFPSYSPPLRSDWHPWRSVAAGIGLIGVAICPWRKLVRRITA